MAGSTSTGGGKSCPSGSACGGAVVGAWDVTESCLTVAGDFDISMLGVGCKSAGVTGDLKVTGKLTLGSDGKYEDKTVTSGSEVWTLGPKCLEISGTTTDCANIGTIILGTMETFGFTEFACQGTNATGCTCQAKINQQGGLGILYNDLYAKGTYKTAGSTLSIGDAPLEYSYCVKDKTMTVTPKVVSPTVAGTITLKSSEVTGGSGGNSGTGATGGTGGRSSTGGTASTGGTTNRGGTTNTGGTSTGGAGGSGGSSGGTTTAGTKPCDIYAAASTPCVAAYSMIRVLAKSYTGPLYAVRKGGGEKNTGTGGTTKDIPSKDGFADVAVYDEYCGTELCTVSKLYDQSGSNNHLVVSKKGTYTGGGGQAAEDDWETPANRKKFKVGGHDVYALYMNTHEGYRFNESTTIPNTKGANQGIYMLVDGTGTGVNVKTSAWGGFCCWDFGTAARDNSYESGTGSMNALFFGQYIAWGKGAEKPPWFMADFEAGIWAGGSGAPNEVITANPTMAGVNYAFGILKTDTKKYSIQVGNGLSGNLTKVNDANLPFSTWKVGGGIILGTGGDNSNWGWGTFYEGAITIGRPSDEADAAVLKNVQDAKYGQ